MRERQHIETALSSFDRITRDLDDNIALVALGEEEGDAGIVAEAETALAKLRQEAHTREVEALLSGEADANDTFVEIHAGAGGTESQDWAEMLMRMYVRWAEAHNYKVEIIGEHYGEEAGIKSGTVLIKGTNAYGWLKTESGVHRLVRISPFDSNERSQHKNRATAWAMLRARLYEAELKRREEEAQAAAAAKSDIGFGHQIRSYVLQPYQLVKDLRTGVESTNPSAVLDGDLDRFIEAALAERIHADVKA
jgi:protein subunit release factor B